MSSLGGGDGETKDKMENGEWRTENERTLVMIADESDVLKSGVATLDWRNSIVFRSAANTVAQHEEFRSLVSRCPDGAKSSKHSMHVGEDVYFAIGHEAITSGMPTLNTPNTTVRMKARMRYFGLIVICAL